MAKRINIILLEKTVAALNRVTKKGDRNRFVDRATLHYIQTQNKQNMQEQLKAGYRANAKQDLGMVAEWFPLGE